MRQSWSVNNLTDFVANSVRNALADDAPFHHLRFERVFPEDFYAEMLEAMPVAEDYRAMSGKSKMGSSRPDGKPTRTKIDLFPEYIRHLPRKKRAVWDFAGSVLCSRELGKSVRKATCTRLKTPVRNRFREGATVSGANPDARHSWLLHHRALGHLLEGHHSPVLSAA